MNSKYFILTTANVTSSHFDETVEISGNERTDNAGTSTILEVSNFDAANEAGAFYGESPYTLEEIQDYLATNSADWD